MRDSRQLTLAGYDRDKVTRFLLDRGWSYFDARCLLRSKFTRQEEQRIKDDKITSLQRNLLFDDNYRSAKLKVIIGQMSFSGKP